MTVPTIRFQRLRPEALLPIRSTPESAGYDVHAFLLSESGRANTKLIPPNNVMAVPTGLAIHPPAGCAALVCSRSGLALKGLFVANAPGIVDPDYTGELMILLYNGGFQGYYVQHEQRIAQLVILPLHFFPLEVVTSMPHTERGAKGFGSTGE